ncbi:hypothetical protein Patl1_15232 [Pistacia atlantica]|uniref:Uncharacterized protein n=1 Tax=Pistacia atlantica TaxID=434234 RepID=A0ACC1B5I8_9ROSI|nr:hypothetical protein Patl1_15232 [Pistacia atlantica]
MYLVLYPSNCPKQIISIGKLKLRLLFLTRICLDSLIEPFLHLLPLSMMQEQS